ncbi:sigma 54-interacting transcriptional regulator [Calorimonas adulescens]|nr:sigma-54-dependent transcriptional regulator [Calorimonas adulescens]
MSNKEKILNFVRESTSRISIDDYKNLKITNLTASFISKSTNISRANVSAILNQLVRDKKLIKIKSKPVYYIDKHTFEESLNVSLSSNIINIEEFKRLINSTNDPPKRDPFEELVGYDGSLKTQIEQAKAAVLYPPLGLHTLIIGPPGTGKTRLAELMFEFSKLMGRHEKFITFNCADYYNNPQLLMAYLFGYVKGAFTGADSDKAGIVESAENGILFLDEVHRLPPEGQEMFFYLIDRGEYHRLGDSKTRSAHLMIIAATTEDPDSALLRTFMRRIPVVIKIPSLDKRAFNEKIEILRKKFEEEAKKLNRDLYIDGDVFKLLSKHNYSGNIGEMTSVVQMACAKALLRTYTSEERVLKIDFSLLPDFIKDNTFIPDSDDSFEFEGFDDIIKISSYCGIKNEAQFDFYDFIISKIKELQDLGYDNDEMVKNINKIIDNYFSKENKPVHEQTFTDLKKLVSDNVIQYVVDLKTRLELELGKKFPDNFIYALSLHIQSLLERTKKGVYAQNISLNQMEKNYPREYGIAKKIVKEMEVNFAARIPKEEISFITLFIASNTIKNMGDETVVILILTHGNSTAKSMAECANKLLNINKIYGFDVSLNMDVLEAFNDVKNLCKKINQGKGILILADMGSLKNFGASITKLTGIPTRTIEKVNMPLVLEAARKAYFLKEDLDTIYYSFTDFESEKKVKNGAIITICSTGVGTASKIKKYINENFPELTQYDIFALDINNHDDIEKITKNYDVKLIIGSINPNLPGVPFVYVDEFFKDKRNVFKKINRNYDVAYSNVYDEIKNDLEELLLYVNPSKFVQFYKIFVRDIQQELGCDLEDEFVLKLGLHIGCAIERIITNNFVVYEAKSSLINEEKLLFQTIRESIKYLEEEFDIKFSDDEICYIIEIFKKCCSVYI